MRNTLMRLSIGSIPIEGTADLYLGPDHPTRAGSTLLELATEKGIVVTAELQPGYLHRGVEKLFEARNFRSVLMLANRHDWQGAFIGELCVATTIEKAMGLVTAPRATWLRTLLSELARLHSHLAFLTYIPFIQKDKHLAETIRNAINQTRKVFSALSGNRVHPMLIRLGGLAVNLDDNDFELILTLSELSRDVLRSVKKIIPTIQGLEAGVLSDSDVMGYGLSGPVAAASGIRIDERDTGYLAYNELPKTPDPEDNTGNCRARFSALVDDGLHSTELIKQCIQLAPEGPVSIRLAKTVKVPEGSYYHSVAAPMGSAGCHLISRGDATPWRLGLRTPTFANCSALSSALVGCPVAAVGHVVASLGYVIGDLDR